MKLILCIMVMVILTAFGCSNNTKVIRSVNSNIICDLNNECYIQRIEKGDK